MSAAPGDENAFEDPPRTDPLTGEYPVHTHNGEQMKYIYTYANPQRHGPGQTNTGIQLTTTHTYRPFIANRHTYNHRHILHINSKDVGEGEGGHRVNTNTDYVNKYSKVSRSTIDMEWNGTDYVFADDGINAHTPGDYVIDETNLVFGGISYTELPKDLTDLELSSIADHIRFLRA